MLQPCPRIPAHNLTWLLGAPICHRPGFSIRKLLADPHLPLSEKYPFLRQGPSECWPAKLWKGRWKWAGWRVGAQALAASHSGSWLCVCLVATPSQTPPEKTKRQQLLQPEQRTRWVHSRGPRGLGGSYRCQAKEASGRVLEQAAKEGDVTLDICPSFLEA